MASYKNEEAKRRVFLAEMYTCLYFCVRHLCEKLLSDRMRSNLGVDIKDVSFFDDQMMK